jgi:hypothetical protein
MPRAQVIMRGRKQAWQDIARTIAASNFESLSALLTKKSFDDIRLACSYIPWALLQSDDYQTAIICRKAYLDLVDHIQVGAGGTYRPGGL